MPSNKYALLRYRIIDKCLRNRYKPFPTKEMLRQACEDALYGSDGENISISTIEKDLWAMRNEGELGFYAPIAYNAQHRGYGYEDENYSLDNIPLNDEDVNAIRFAATTLYQFRDIALFEQFGTAIDKLLDRLNISPQFRDADMAQYIQFESAPAYIGSRWLGPLLEAVMQQQVVDMAYAKFDGTQASRYRVEPFLLKEYRNRWYLVGWNTARQSIATYGLERIQSLEVSTERFLPGKRFDAHRYFMHCFGITSGSGQPLRVVLRFGPLAGRYVTSQPMHHSQQVVVNTATHVDVALDVYPSPELNMQILSFGEDVEVLQPAALRREIAAILQRAAGSYNG